MNLLKKSVLLTSVPYIKEICFPLKKYFNISYFGYVKTYLDNTHLALSTSAEWMTCFYENFHNKAIIHKTMDAYQSGEFLWSQFSNSMTVQVAQNQFDIAHGIMIIKKNDDFCEFFGFATDKSNYKIENWYLRNMDVLDRFCLYFKEAAGSLIKKAENDRFILPSQSNKKKSLYQTPKIILRNLDARLSFFNEISTESPYRLSKRQLQCLYYLSRGKTLKEIAKILNLSSKTVEHYLEITKSKLKCSKRSELIEIFLDCKL
jgi:DNA-binding CsgD family transcriptional regulator